MGAKIKPWHDDAFGSMRTSGSLLENLCRPVPRTGEQNGRCGFYLECLVTGMAAAQTESCRLPSKTG